MIFYGWKTYKEPKKLHHDPESEYKALCALCGEKNNSPQSTQWTQSSHPHETPMTGFFWHTGGWLWELGDGSWELRAGSWELGSWDF